MNKTLFIIILNFFFMWMVMNLNVGAFYREEDDERKSPTFVVTLILSIMCGACILGYAKNNQLLFFAP